MINIVCDININIAIQRWPNPIMPSVYCFLKLVGVVYRTILQHCLTWPSTSSETNTTVVLPVTGQSTWLNECVFQGLRISLLTLTYRYRPYLMFHHWRHVENKYTGNHCGHKLAMWLFSAVPCRLLAELHWSLKT